MKTEDEYSKYLVAEFEYWEVYVHQHQENLGRSYLWARRADATDFLDMNPDEQTEFFEVARKLRGALTTLFRPDLFNYEDLENETRHLHVHVTPRYSTPIEFAGLTFFDPQFGGRLTPKRIPFPDEVIFKIRDAIKEQLDKNPP